MRKLPEATAASSKNGRESRRRRREREDRTRIAVVISEYKETRGRDRGEKDKLVNRRGVLAAAGSDGSRGKNNHARSLAHAQEETSSCARERLQLRLVRAFNASRAGDNCVLRRGKGISAYGIIQFATRRMHYSRLLCAPRCGSPLDGKRTFIFPLSLSLPLCLLSAPSHRRRFGEILTFLPVEAGVLTRPRCERADNWSHLIAPRDNAR